MDPTPMPIETIISSTTSLFGTLGIAPYVFAGAIIGLLGFLIRSAKKAGK